ALLTITLLVILYSRRTWVTPIYLALTLIAVPQAMYIYCYANSDAWALSWSIFLFLQTAALVAVPPFAWRWWRVAGWMFTFLMLLLSKSDFYASFLLPVILMIVALIHHRDSIPRPAWLWLSTRLVVPIIVVFVVAGFWDPAFSIHRTSWKDQLAEMKDQHAQYNYKHSNPDSW